VSWHWYCRPLRTVCLTICSSLDSRVPRSAVDNHYRSDDEGNDLNSQFAELNVSQGRFNDSRSLLNNKCH
jgi:hypothetical protein